MSNKTPNLDLDISNYNVTELLNLFNLQSDFNEDELKRAYKQTLMTHPDKSGLSKEYFLFFSRAFKKVKYLYDFKNKHKENQKCVYNNNVSYDAILDNDTIIIDIDVDKELKEQINTKTNTSDFNKKFNKLFDEVKIYDEEHDDGYDEWITHTPITNENAPTITNARSLNEYIERKKQEMKSLVVYEGVEEMNSCSSIGNISNLKREKPKYYESGLFSKMQFEDYKRAHSETVIPVTHDDYLNRKQYNNVNELMNHRRDTETVSSLDDAQEILRQKRNTENEESIGIAYNLTKQMERIEESNQKWNANFNLLLDR